MRRVTRSLYDIIDELNYRSVDEELKELIGSWRRAPIDCVHLGRFQAADPLEYDMESSWNKVEY